MSQAQYYYSSRNCNMNIASVGGPREELEMTDVLAPSTLVKLMLNGEAKMKNDDCIVELCLKNISITSNETGETVFLDFAKYDTLKAIVDSFFDPRHEPHTNQTQGYIYGIRVTGSNHVKIGFSTDPWQRLSQLQVVHVDNFEIICLKLCADARSAETQAHHELWDAHIHGDWFNVPENSRITCVLHAASYV
jgi:hypothetical protein